MAEEDVSGVDKLLEASNSYHIRSLLSSPDRDYLVRISGEQVTSYTHTGGT